MCDGDTATCAWKDTFVVHSKIVGGVIPMETDSDDDPPPIEPDFVSHTLLGAVGEDKLQRSKSGRTSLPALGGECIPGASLTAPFFNDHGANILDYIDPASPDWQAIQGY